MLLLQNGRVLDPYTGTDAPRDVLIGDDGVIAAVSKRLQPPPGCECWDAAGLTVSPDLWMGMCISAIRGRRKRRTCSPALLLLPQAATRP
ncbi:hypothetical protein RX717_01515 [Intestinibacillus sp. NTUH-41-i26]|uniref:hypothetical protein n=1 Tax=Intestinibacillus sp. NTUH-41-i26 TaxID=3079303 RepID=UPI002934C05B|nr:hypothetical protein [Intestinibacillus sp. NTUH-41-i26]WOC75699.1 hypothetical protein RX717_01515 [Intestinibacillus sp. NTUH-41-i26]